MTWSSPPQEAPGPDHRAQDQTRADGVFYVNRNDPRLLVEKRSGLGMTFNYAHPGAWILTGGLFVLLSLVQLCFFMLFHSPITLVLLCVLLVLGLLLAVASLLIRPARDEPGQRAQGPQTVQQERQVRVQRSTRSLRNTLQFYGEAMNRAPAWGFSPFPLAKRLTDGTIEVTTYHLEGQWQTMLCQTEEAVVDQLYSRGDETWDPGIWTKPDERGKGIAP